MAVEKPSILLAKKLYNGIKKNILNRKNPCIDDGNARSKTLGGKVGAVDFQTSVLLKVLVNPKLREENNVLA